jgi:AraC-like DNA-binding protein
MRGTLGRLGLDGLERSCVPPRNAIRFGASLPGVERAEVFLSSWSFEPHRHDTYAIGITTSGVQTFQYRGCRRICLPGQLHILHPDEPHDGGPATDNGFGYRILYVAPNLVRDALGGSALPFVADPVQKPTRSVAALLDDIDEPISDLAGVEIAVTLADMLRSLGRRSVRQELTIDARAVRLAREYLSANAREQTRASTLERLTGLDRFTLTHHFRRAYGTTPDRYRTMRRLALARSSIERGQPLARAAVEAGFADQSHMTRHFKQAYGLTPGRWARAVRTALGPPRETAC